MKNIITLVLLSFLWTSSVFADEVKSLLFGDYYANQKKSEIEMKDFKQIDGAQYNLAGDIWSKNIVVSGEDQELLLKFNGAGELIFTTLVKKSSSFVFSDMLKAPETKNRMLMLKGQIKDNVSGKDVMYSLEKNSSDAPLSNYQLDLETLEYFLTGSKTEGSYLLKTSFVEELSKADFRGISRIATCSFEKKEHCSQCEFVQGANMARECTIFEVYHPVK